MNNGTLTYTVKEAWQYACQEEGIPEDTKFAVFSESNQWAKRYNKAVVLYFAARKEAIRLSR